jgi:hypothetical protein
VLVSSITEWCVGLQTSVQGTLAAIRDWFRDYKKIPDGKPPKVFRISYHG